MCDYCMEGKKNELILINTRNTMISKFCSATCLKHSVDEHLEDLNEDKDMKQCPFCNGEGVLHKQLIEQWNRRYDEDTNNSV